jgi:glutathione S-transferase
MSTYKLYYFNARGRAEVSRLIFAAAGQTYDDVRYGNNEWGLHAHEMPLGEIPVLEFNGRKLPQSLAIASFLAKQFGLAGRDNFEQAEVDAVVELIRILITQSISIKHEEDQTKKEELIAKFFDTELPEILHSLEILAKQYSNCGPFFVGNHLTWADLLFYNITESILELDQKCLNNHPWLKQNRAEVARQPRIAEYLRNRPKTLF